LIVVGFGSCGTAPSVERFTGSGDAGKLGFDENPSAAARARDAT
jgi:hypothetical protein